MNHGANKRRGFTIIELMLAMSFIAVLLVAIAMTIIQISTIYTKGLTLKEVNQTGRDISDDLRRTVAASGKVELPGDFVEVKNGATTVGGRLCLGNSTYIWNYGAAIESNNVRLTKYTPDTGEKIRFVRVPDSAKGYCATNASGQVLVPNLLASDTANARELLREGDRTLSLHNLSVDSSASSYDPATGQRLFRLSFTLGTQKTELINLGATPITCKTPSEIGTDLNYCTVQEFSLVVRTGGEV
jgi:prepilin-type N-terminal cleavage/methylation domain-containing protein